MENEIQKKINKENITNNKTQSETIEENKPQILQRKWDVNKDELKAKISNYFGNKLENQEEKFKADIKIVKPIKIHFVELYHTLEDLKLEVKKIINTKNTNFRKESRSFSRNSIIKRESFNSKNKLNTSMMSNKSMSKTPTKSHY